jgi:hypothetical protein
VGKVAAGSAAMGVAVWISSYIVRHTLKDGVAGHLADLAISIPVGLAVLYWVCRWLQVDELEMAIRAIGGPLGRRLGRPKNQS